VSVNFDSIKYLFYNHKMRKIKLKKLFGDFVFDYLISDKPQPKYKNIKISTKEKEMLAKKENRIYLKTTDVKVKNTINYKPRMKENKYMIHNKIIEDKQ
jgi:hypothetical protein